MKSVFLSAAQTPVATASWPIERCIVPCIRPLAKRPSTASSKKRIANSDSSEALAASLFEEIDPCSGANKGVMVAIFSLTFLLTFVQLGEIMAIHRGD